MEANVASTAIAEAMRKKPLIPAPNSAIAGVFCNDSPVKIASMLFGGRVVAMTAPISASPIDCPMKRIVASVPAATPNFDLLTEPITALVFGDENMPKPTPSTISLHAISQPDDEELIPAEKNKPMATRSMPELLRILEPKRSESHPLNGDRSAIAADSAIR